MANIRVFKVQYGNMLRRFSAQVDENYGLVLDMDGLRAKIFSFFGFSPDADLTLTYIDEDGDKVTLVDNDDLRDVMKQQLDFVMIDVVLNSDKVDKFHTKSSGHIVAADLSKSLPDPLLEGLSKLALDSASNAASSSPLVALESVSKAVGFALEMVKNLGSRSQIQDSGASAGSNASKDESKTEELLKDATTSSEVSNASKDENMPEELLKNASTSKGSNASEDETIQKELLKCATSTASNVKSCLRSLEKNATSSMPNTSKGKSKPEEFLKDVSSKGLNALKYGDRQKLVPKLTTKSESKQEVVDRLKHIYMFLLLFPVMLLLMEVALLVSLKLLLLMVLPQVIMFLLHSFGFRRTFGFGFGFRLKLLLLMVLPQVIMFHPKKANNLFDASSSLFCSSPMFLWSLCY